jgi:hypothetical protein
MDSRIPFTEPSPDSQTQADKPKEPEPPATKPKATFEWPPDCLWPFVDHKAGSDT